MDSEQNDFESLRRLLACKRHEQPPAGYFNRFPDRVMARIEAECLGPPLSWWGWMLAKLETKPILACAYGLVVSTLLLAGFQFSEVFDAEAASAPIAAAPWLATAPAHPTLAASARNAALRDQPMPADSTSLSAAFRPEVSNLFLKTANARFQTVGYTFGH